MSPVPGPPPTGGSELMYRFSRPRAAVAATGAAVLAAAALAFPAAAAPEPSPAALSPVAAGKLSATIAAQLGDDAAGAYYEAETQKLVVNVLNESAANRVRRAGAEARIVEHSLAELDAAQTSLTKRATIPGTSWASDPRANKVVVTADRTVTGAALERLASVVDRLGSRADLRRIDSEIQPYLSGGDAIWSGRVRCSLGFNVVRNGEPYFLTAGHCGDTGTAWSAFRGGPQDGVTEDSRFPDDDFALVRYTSDEPHPSQVNLYGGTQEITEAGDAIVGQRVRRSGSTTQVRGGWVTGLNATVNYQQGSVHGLIRTTVCAEPGDSGGPLFDGETALGLTSGGSGNCTTGGTTYYQPVPEALEAYEARIG
ncbi:S1 family peptidase [Streptomyces lycii]|nr:S1 family peptidase [Streptomyces lycii]